MHFSEDDLRAALQRRDPGKNFTQRVMAGIEPLAANPRKARTVPPVESGLLPRLLAAPMRWITAGALTVVLLVSGGVLEYSHRHREEQQRIAGERARQDTIFAVEMTGAKLKQVLQRTRQAQQHEAKIRSERL
ncbi:MAG TPA: hypothetical protein VKT33_02520 [Candidatus Angelobacter sp.]|nr:hypothetical protein [Candidatus Angelobacter sp.]